MTAIPGRHPHVPLLSLALAVGTALAGCHASKPARTPDEQLAPATQPQEASTDGMTLVPAPARRGLMAIANRGAAHFTVFFAGKKLEVPEGEATNVIVDGQIVQLVVVPADQLLAGAPAPADDEALLRRHMEWELGFLSDQLGQQLETKAEPYRAPSGVRCLAWEVAIPPQAGESPDQAMHANIFLSTVLAGHVVVLGSPVVGKDDPKAVRARLRAAMDTFTPSPSFLDPAKLRDELAKEQP